MSQYDDKTQKIIFDLCESIYRDHEASYYLKQISRLAMKSLTQETYPKPKDRTGAEELVRQLRLDFDLIDDSAMMRTLVEEMEKRHEDGFNAFFETILARFLEAVGQTEVTFNTEHMIAEMFAPSRLEVFSSPGHLTYRLREESDDDTQH